MISFLWVGITQRDLLQKGQFREYKFYKSGVNIPSTNEHWANRFLPSYDYPEACGHIVLSTDNWQFHDEDCIVNQGFICEW